MVAQKAPYAKDLEAGKTYYWCACGRSANQPFCDGKHKDFGLAPLAFTAEESGPAYLCGCKADQEPALLRRRPQEPLTGSDAFRSAAAPGRPLPRPDESCACVRTPLRGAGPDRRGQR